MDKKVFAKIQAVSGSVSPSLYQMRKEVISIGRDKAADIFVNDKKASRNHVLITHTNGIFRIDDLGSTNGTSINGQKIEKTQFINYGDTIIIGDSQLTFTQSVEEPSNQNKRQIIFTVIIAILVLAATISSVIFFGKSRTSYEVVERRDKGSILYSFSVPMNFQSTQLNNFTEIIYNTDKNKFGSFFLKSWDKKLSGDELVAFVEDFETIGFGLLNPVLEDGMFIINQRTSQWNNTKNPKINAYIAEYEGITSFTDVKGKYFWESKNSTIYLACMSASFDYDYLIGYLFADTLSQNSIDKDSINRFIETLKIDIK